MTTCLWSCARRGRNCDSCETSAPCRRARRPRDLMQSMECRPVGPSHPSRVRRLLPCRASPSRRRRHCCRRSARDGSRIVFLPPGERVRGSSCTSRRPGELQSPSYRVRARRNRVPPRVDGFDRARVLPQFESRSAWPRARPVADRWVNRPIGRTKLARPTGWQEGSRVASGFSWSVRSECTGAPLRRLR